MCSYLDQVGSTYYFRRAVPKDLLGFFKTSSGKPRTEWKFSLGVKDRESAKRQLRPHEVETDDLIDAARHELARTSTEAPEVSLRPQRELEEEAARGFLEEESRKRREARSDLRTLWRIRRHTSTAMLAPEEAAAIDLLREQDAELAALRQAVSVLNAGNQRLGIAPINETSTSSRIELGVLFDRYAVSGAAKPKTVRKWRRAVEKLIEHLGHDDARHVTRADMNAWIARLVAEGLSRKTIVDGYLPAIRAAFAIAHDDGELPANPAAGLTVRAPKPVKPRERDHSDGEAATILRAALQPQPPKLTKHHALARRWVPWLCAYTGARVGEMTQLRAMDIQKEGGIWYVLISPEADGGVKTNEARKVPLHSHLVEQGITQLAKAGDATPLFYRQGAGNEINPASKIRASDLAKWVRSLGIITPQPNHGWRHRFKTQSRAAGIPEHIADKIQGHAPRHEGGKYGSVPLATLRDAIEKLPRYQF
ncbi:putative site-specific recombinase [Caenibius tardaugens NBRC 16725]|uniref:Putative site-specific recombinase n=1 Tax=Caenibius tardaugens NBRC 16725 TaxID=1219035 RepID=U2ZUF2_9SPHN|nr:DUF6538 domain-containing protein [Caenibius tardaugens]AZI35940.1 hypothetical protein EGO55_08175 [Caenibius tardaugens NBRC 16725]GAD49009.1 putative site-specific recombinase [Caenibius tardaugens NBRC 16725]